MYLISLNSILYFQAERAYTKLILKERDNLIICKHLIVFEKLIKAHGFLRIHRSFLVNISKISFFQSKHRIVKIQENEIPVSKRNCDKIFKILLSKGIKDGNNKCRL
jgi:two-component system LytT family response regulator